MVHLYISQLMDTVVSHSYLGGQACVFTTRSPDKATPNEDAAAVIQVGEDSGVLVIADGVGGSRLGDRASAATVHQIRDHLAGADVRASLRAPILDGIDAANREVLKLGVGAASTLVLVEIRERRARPYHIGDSVGLVVGQRGKMKWQTTPHSPVGFAQVAGVLNEHEALHHEHRHIVSNVVGTEDMRIEVGAMQPLALRDTVVLGSDGLFDNVRMEELVATMRRGRLETCVARLAGLALHRMQVATAGEPSKPDDLTIVAWRPSRVSRLQNACVSSIL